MPHLSFPMSPDGPALLVVVALHANEIAIRQHAGAAVPLPLQVRALIDTGTDVTALAPRVRQLLGLAPVLSTSTLTAGGQVTVDLFEVSVVITGPKGTAGPMYVRPYLLVTELATPLPNLEVLIGRDILAECLFQQDGPGANFLLAW
jgi:hypothetical protein